MKRRTALAGVAVGSAALGVVSAAPAGAARGDWTNNGCDYSGENYRTSGKPGAQTWETYASGGSFSCSNVWVELHWLDSKGKWRYDSAYNYSSSGMATSVSSNDPNATDYYSCHAGRSRSAGNWSVVRQLGSGALCPSSPR